MGLQSHLQDLYKVHLSLLVTDVTALTYGIIGFLAHRLHIGRGHGVSTMIGSTGVSGEIRSSHKPVLSLVVTQEDRPVLSTGCESVLLDPVAKRIARQSQQLSGSGFIAPRLLQRLPDQVLLQFL